MTKSTVVHKLDRFNPCRVFVWFYKGKPPQSEMALKFVVLRRLILNIKLLEISSSLLNPGNFVNNNAILTAGGKAFVNTIGISFAIAKDIPIRKIS